MSPRCLSALLAACCRCWHATVCLTDCRRRAFDCHGDRSGPVRRRLGDGVAGTTVSMFVHFCTSPTLDL
ncbi:hypothetical protein PF005_g31603 [Phytophthora fragariae]|uniref:Secreted protein n=2 Tax=Phytophthora TaxID=4783 RepID=A0A6A3V8B4_9STRA|nr:hypothetical protein PF003_g20242 [Phytophthora fragariae]KAE8961443.1 hypothetical protein PR001_g30037 [Phytophthora rubi]KAE8918008.1 hypothetical protein PF009_g31675 [Phytophthora fragariae]KAE8958643.1 hypothetical protein PF011_g30691 [Phytophthora fragariae]KAE9058671.1 hypothetical protein PF007_g31222 [Phytophthora fragariae]